MFLHFVSNIVKNIVSDTHVVTPTIDSHLTIRTTIDIDLISLEQQLDHALDHAQAATARADALQRRLSEVCVAHEAIHFTAISWE